MAKEVEQEIKTILGEITEVNSKNEQKIICIGSWNGRPDTVEIRKYNTSDEVMTKGIGFEPEEAANLLYIMLSNPSEIPYDRERVYQILKEQENLEVDVQQLVAQLPDGQMPTHIQAEIGDDYDGLEYVEQGPVYANGIRRIVPKKNGLFNHMWS